MFQEDAISNNVPKEPKLRPGALYAFIKRELDLTMILTLMFCLETYGPTPSSPSDDLMLLLGWG